MQLDEIATDCSTKIGDFWACGSSTGFAEHTVVVDSSVAVFFVGEGFFHFFADHVVDRLLVLEPDKDVVGLKV